MPYMNMMQVAIPAEDNASSSWRVTIILGDGVAKNLIVSAVEESDWEIRGQVCVRRLL